MRKLTRFGALALMTLLIAGVLAACGDPTATPVPAKTEAAMAKTTEAAMMAKETPGGAMAKTTEAAMIAKTTEAAMMAKTTEAAMMAKETPGVMVKPTEAAMVKTTEAAMVKTTEAAIVKTTEAAVVKTTEAAVVKTTEAAVVKTGPIAGDFNNKGAEPVAGKAILGATPDGKLILRLENLKSAPGPDLYVYLVKEGSPTKDTQIKAGLEIGKLKATSGNLNYELDSKLDISQYKSVVVYCKSFSAIFGYANLTTTVS